MAPQGLGLAFGKFFAQTYGGLTPLQAIKDGVGFRTSQQAIGTVFGTTVINAALIGGSFQAGVYLGSMINVGIGRAINK